MGLVRGSTMPDPGQIHSKSSEGRWAPPLGRRSLPPPRKIGGAPRHATLTPLRFTGRLYVHSDPNAAQGAQTDGLLEGEHCSCQFMSWKVWKRAPPLLLCSAGTSSGVQAFSSVIWVPLGGEWTDLDATAMASVASSLSSVSVVHLGSDRHCSLRHITLG